VTPAEAAGHLRDLLALLTDERQRLLPPEGQATTTPYIPALEVAIAALGDDLLAALAGAVANPRVHRAELAAALEVARRGDAGLATATLRRFDTDRRTRTPGRWAG
jgi:hypothetical protein